MPSSAITPLHQLHIELGAKLVPFAGYEMPLHYKTGIIAEHTHTRNSAGLFDISHMGQIRILGKDAAIHLEKLLPTDIQALQPLQQCYTIFTNLEGGVLDDLIIMNLDSNYLLIVNAACKHADIQHLNEYLPNHCNINLLDNQVLLALQGPHSRNVLTKIFPIVSDLLFMNVSETEYKGMPCLITCSGYTGEDGFEISISAEIAEELVRSLLEDPDVLPIGLGARDTLRQEAGMCLYGHDLTVETTPIEAGLSWVVSKSRRPQGDRASEYLGVEKITEQLEKGVEKKRVGILPDGKMPIREGTMIMDEKGYSIGSFTSGCYSPSLRKPIAMGYVLSTLAVSGTQIYTKVRNKRIALTITQPSFVPTNYYK